MAYAPHTFLQANSELESSLECMTNAIISSNRSCHCTITFLVRDQHCIECYHGVHLGLVLHQQMASVFIQAIMKIVPIDLPLVLDAHPLISRIAVLSSRQQSVDARTDLNV